MTVALDDAPAGIDSHTTRNAALFAARAAAVAELEQAQLLHRDRPDDFAVQVRLRRAATRVDQLTAEIMLANSGLVASEVRRFTQVMDTDKASELEAAGRVGLMWAVRNYDPSKGKFASWAYKPIKREVLRAVRDADFNNLTHGDFERRPSVVRAYRRLTEHNPHYAPSHAEVSAESGQPVEVVARILDAPRMESLDAPAGADFTATVGDTVPDPELGVEQQVAARMLDAGVEVGLRVLDPREYFVVSRRFGLDGEPPARLVTLGEHLGLSREAVRQIEAKALAKLQHPCVVRRILGEEESRVA